MALTLSLSYVERNDNKVLTITDTTVNWGTGGNIPVSGITTLTLDIDITTSSGETISYDQIDLVTELGLGGGSTQADLVFELNATDLLLAGVAYGTVDTELPDGIWDFEYNVDEGAPATEASLSDSELIYGVVKNDLYALLRQINTAYELDDCIDDGVVNVIFAKTYLDAMLVSDVAARRTAVIDQLYTLERILLNIASYDI